MTNIPLIRPDLPSLDEVAGPFREILENGRVTNFGKYVRTFKAEAGEYLGVPTVTVSSGTVGLVFALQAVGLGKGQKVVAPSFTFKASAQAILYAGGVPGFAEGRSRSNAVPGRPGSGRRPTSRRGGGP